MIEASVRVGLPGLDQPIGNGLTGAVVQGADDPDRAGGIGRYHEVAVRPAEPDVEVRSDGLRRGESMFSARHRGPPDPRTWSPWVRAARCRSGRRALNMDSPRRRPSDRTS